jgi:hypothetical protein
MLPKPSDKRQVFAKIPTEFFECLKDQARIDGFITKTNQPDLARVLEGLLVGYSRGLIRIPADCLSEQHFLHPVVDSDVEDNKWNR